MANLRSFQMNTNHTLGSDVLTITLNDMLTVEYCTIEHSKDFAVNVLHHWQRLCLKIYQDEYVIVCAVFLRPIQFSLGLEKIAKPVDCVERAGVVRAQGRLKALQPPPQHALRSVQVALVRQQVAKVGDSVERVGVVRAQGRLEALQCPPQHALSPVQVTLFFEQYAKVVDSGERAGVARTQGRL
eukprot:scaffold211706_cov25-Prasinocladus_malaysianus.AAC.3